MSQEREKPFPHCESGSEQISEATMDDSSTLSDVDTEVQQENDVMHVEECTLTLEEYVKKEMHLCSERAHAKVSEYYGGNDKEPILSRITSRLEDIKSRSQEKSSMPQVSISRSFLQYSNELMCSFDTKSSKAVRNVIARFGDHVAVGDSNGHVLILQTSSQQGQLLKYGAGAIEDVGGVTALKMVSYGKSILLVSGHVSGVLRIWELRYNQQWTHCKDITGCHAATISSIGVTHVGMSMWLLSADTHGRLLSHNVQRFLSITAQALAGISRQLTGQATSPSYLNSIRVGDVNDIGVVLSMSGPYLHEGLAASSEMICPYMIMCTEKGTILVEIGQNGKVEYRSTLAGFDGSQQNGVYSATWRRYVDSREEDDTVIAAVSSGEVVNTYRCKVPKKTGRDMTFDHIKCLTCAGIVQGITYIQDEAVLACVYFNGESGKTRMALIQEEDYCRGNDVIVESCANIECRNTSDWVISQPIDHLVTVDLVWHGSIVGGSDVMLLTSSGIRCTQLLSWQQKLGMMVASELYEDALLHVSRLYYSLQGVHTKSNRMDWCANRVEAHDLPAVKKQFASLLIMYLQQGLDDFRKVEKSSGITPADRSTMSGIVHLSFDVCLLLDSLEMFYHDIASVLQEEGNEHSMSWEIFIEVLAFSIRQGVYSSKLPPDLIRMLVENLISRSEIQSIEQLLLSLEISSLDLNQIIPLCVRHGLHSVILYVFSQGLKDYKTPAALLFSSAVEEYMSSKGKGLAMKLMVYIYACFKGFLYPLMGKHGSSEQEQIMKLEAMDFILFSSLEQLVEVVHLWESVANITRNHEWASFCEMYSSNPVLDFLCEVDVTGSLNLLQELFSGWDALVQDIIQHRGDSQNSYKGDAFRTLSQATVDKLVEILNLEENSPEQMDAAKMNFILHHVACDRASLPPEAAFSVLSYLLHTSKVSLIAFESCQKSFEDIVDHLEDLPDGRLMDMAHQAGFSSAEARIYRKRGQFLKGLVCLLESVSDGKKAFLYYKDIMSDSKISLDEKIDFQRSSVPYFPRMVEIDPDSTAELAIDFAGEQRQGIITTFNPESNGLFLLLQSLISKIKERSWEEDQKMVCGIAWCPMLCSMLAFSHIL